MIIPLDQVPAGRKTIVEKIESGHGAFARLYSLGLVPGSEVEVIVNRFVGPIVIRVRGITVSIGRGLARRVYVRVVG